MQSFNSRRYYSAETYAQAETTKPNTEQLPLANAYIPSQQFKTLLNMKDWLSSGTIFPELVMPAKPKL